MSGSKHLSEPASITRDCAIPRDDLAERYREVQRLRKLVYELEQSAQQNAVTSQSRAAVNDGSR